MNTLNAKKINRPKDYFMSRIAVDFSLSKEIYFSYSSVY